MTEIQKLLDIMAALRDPETGCPWDVEQDFASIAPYTLEEAYEVVDVIERGAYDELPDELGDLLLQVVFHAQMANEKGWFGFEDVARAINEKMVRRHPHVFADEARGDADRQLTRWEDIKAGEKSAAKREDDSVLAGIPIGMPALQRAEKLGRKAKRVGFDWSAAPAVRDQIDAELAELDSAANQTELEAELGDVLFSVVQYARHRGVDPAAALRGANQRFEQRFRHMEQQFAAETQTLSEVSEARWEAAWRAAKAALSQ